MNGRYGIEMCHIGASVSQVESSCGRKFEKDFLTSFENGRRLNRIFHAKKMMYLVMERKQTVYALVAENYQHFLNLV